MNQSFTDGYLTHDLADGVLTLSLGAAPAHALSLGMIRALKSLLDDTGQNPDVRVVILHGEGRIFCAGHDLKEIRRHRDDADDGRAYVETLFTECGDMMTALARLPQPTLAVVEGVATAGGLQLMASCDMTFAAHEARFCLPGVNNGGFCTTPSVAVSRKLGRNHMLELALSGEMFDSDWALRAGLVNRVYPVEQVLTQAQAFARILAGRYAPAIASGKAMLYTQMEVPLEQAYAAATEVMIGHFMDPHRIATERARD